MDFVVGGIARSGTTALSIALCAHRDIYAYASETALLRYAHDFFRSGPFPDRQFQVLRRQLEADLDIALNLHTNDFVVQQAKDIELLGQVAGKKRLFPLFDAGQAARFKDDAIKLFASGSHGPRLMRELCNFLGREFRVHSDRRIVGEKTPDNIRAMADLHGALPGCKAIATIRDPFATLKSMAGRAARGLAHDLEFSKHLSRNIGLYLDSLRTLRTAAGAFDDHPLLVLRYEDMLDDTAEVMKKAFAHLGAKPDDEAVALACRILRPRPDRGSAPSFFHPVEQALIAKLLGPAVKKYGYELPAATEPLSFAGLDGASDPDFLRDLEAGRPMLLAMAGFHGSRRAINGAWMAATGTALLIVPDDIAEISLEVWTGCEQAGRSTGNFLKISGVDGKIAGCELGARGDRSVLNLDCDELPLAPLLKGLRYAVLEFSATNSFRPVEIGGDGGTDDLREQSVRILDVTYRSYRETVRRQRTVISDLRQQLTGQRHLIVDAEKRAATAVEQSLAFSRELERERELLVTERAKFDKSLQHEQGELVKARETARAEREKAQQELENEREQVERDRQFEREQAEETLRHEQALLAEERKQAGQAIEHERAVLAEERVAAQKNIDHERARADSVLGSTSWRLTRPLRQVTEGARRARRLSTRAAWRAGKIGVMIAPLPEHVKSRLKRRVEQRLGQGPEALSGAASSSILAAPAPLDVSAPPEPVDDAPSEAAPEALPAEQHPPPEPLADLDAAAARFKHAAQRRRNRPADVPEPLDGAPEVSIIIPVYNQVEYTLQCLASVEKYTADIAYEIIVVDDCSSDRTRELLERDKRITYHRNDENLGFIGSCHAGADKARGRYLVFLNNDTETLTNWLIELVETLEYAPDAGIAGAQLIYPDGKLQEAGGIVWQDGSAWNYGRLSDPLAPQVAYLREADYVSGAALAISKDLWQRSGGFDFHYKPAYGEDSDLAFKVRAMGYKVYYQPLAKVIHYEGISSGTDVTQGIKAYQVENAKKLYERWKGEMAGHRPNGEAPEFEKERATQKRLLVIDACTPEPDKDAGSITTWEIMRAAQHLGYKVTFIPESNFTYIDKYSDDLARVGVESLYHPFETAVADHLRKRGADYDAIMIFRAPDVRKYLDDIKKHANQARLILHASDLHFLRAERQAGVLGLDKASLDPATLKREELEVINAVDCTVVHSTYERDLLATEKVSSKVVVFPWIMDVNGRGPGFEGRDGLMFLGGYQHDPNVDAVDYFAREILPLVKRQLPDAEFFAVGSKPPTRLHDLKDQGVTVAGFVEDLRTYLDRCRLAVVPLRYGAGIKGKLATTMSYGLPSVSTAIGVEGMDLEGGAEVLMADSPQDFADAVVRLYNDEALWHSISDAGLAYVGKVYSRKAGRAIMETILGDDTGD